MACQRLEGLFISLGLLEKSLARFGHARVKLLVNRDYHPRGELLFDLFSARLARNHFELSNRFSAFLDGADQKSVPAVLNDFRQCAARTGNYRSSTG